MALALSSVELDFAPNRLSGIVYGALLNHRPALAALGGAVNEPPYKAAPVAPVLYQKPRNTLAANGTAVTVPDDVSELELGPALGLVIGRTACRVPAERAFDYVAGYIAIADICIPHESFYRPSLRFRARDGFCVLGSAAMPATHVANPDALSVRVRVDGAVVHESTTGDRIRPAARLLADVTDFMTLSPGDILMLGVPAGSPKVSAGQRASIEIGDLAPLDVRFVAEGGAQ